MPISIVWDADTRTITHSFTGDWTWAEYRGRLEQIIKKEQLKDGRFDIIADLLSSNPIPPGNAFPTLKYMASQAPDDVQGMFVVVGGGMFVQILGETFKRAYRGQGARIAFTTTLEEAYALIESDRAAQRNRA